MKIFSFLIFCLALTACWTDEDKPWGPQSFLPPNDLWMQDRMVAANITETEFNQILDTIEQTYKPIIAALGGNLVLERDWSDPTVNAYADRQGTNFIVHMYGGMARRSELNVIGFGLVACHELGHHLAGFPYYAWDNWAANEGQSDYFAPMACGRKVFDSLATPEIPATGKSKCDTAFADDLNRSRCYKNVSGGIALASLLATLGGSSIPSLDTPDPSVVSKTQDKHPKAQCRLDTMFQGALCTMSWNDSTIPQKDGAVCDTRPKCWFAKQGDTTPTPTPSPGDEANYLLMGLYNNFRVSRRVPVLLESDPLVCAAIIHALDMGTNQMCSHRGSDGSTIGQRIRSCGYKYGVMQHISCGEANEDAVVYEWTNDWSNRYVMQSRNYHSIGCASYNGFYVCLAGTK